MTENPETQVGAAGEVYIIDENIGYVIAEALFQENKNRLKPQPDYLVRGFRLAKLLTGSASCQRIVVDIITCDHGPDFCCHCLHELSSSTKKKCKCECLPPEPPTECVSKNGRSSASHSGYDCNLIAPFDERNKTYSKTAITGKRTIWVGGKNIGRYAVTELMTIFSKGQDWHLLRVRPGNDHADLVIDKIAQTLKLSNGVRIWSNDWNEREWPSCRSNGNKQNIIVTCATMHEIEIDVVGNVKLRRDADHHLRKQKDVQGRDHSLDFKVLTRAEMVELVKSIRKPWQSDRPPDSPSHHPQVKMGTKMSTLVVAQGRVTIEDFCGSAAITAADIQRSTDLRAALEAKFTNVDDFATLPRHNPVSRQHQVASVVP